MEKTFTGKTIEEAVESAAKELGVSQDSFSYEIVEMPKKGFFGLGSVLAKINVKYEISAEDKVEQYLSGLFNIIGLEGCKTSITVEEDNINISIDGEAADIFLRKQGEAIEALQMIIALSVNHENDSKYKVSLNINDYREKSKERLEALAARIARQVQKSHRRVTLNPMSAYQRRIIHTRLQEEPNITTFSVGSEPNRKVVIAYQGEDGEQRPQRKSNGKGGYKKNFNKPAHRNNDNANTEEGGVTEISFVEGEKRAPRVNKEENASSNEKRSGGNKKPYNKKPYSDRPRQPRPERKPVETSAEATEPTVELRAGEKRAHRTEN